MASNTNMTSMPGTDCWYPLGGVRRAPEGVASTVMVRGAEASRANSSCSGGASAESQQREIGQNSVRGFPQSQLVVVRAQPAAVAREPQFRLAPGQHALRKARRDRQPPAKPRQPVAVRAHHRKPLALEPPDEFIGKKTCARLRVYGYRLAGLDRSARGHRADEEHEQRRHQKAPDPGFALAEQLAEIPARNP
jgi:hypothetical protein